MPEFVKALWTFQLMSVLTGAFCSGRFVWNLNKKQETVKGVWLLTVFALAHYLVYSHSHHWHRLSHAETQTVCAADLPSVPSAFAGLWKATSWPGWTQGCCVFGLAGLSRVCHGSDSAWPLIPRRPLSLTGLRNAGCLGLELWERVDPDREPKCEEEVRRLM